MSKDKAKWVIYKDIKSKVTMEMVLGRYGLLDKLKRSGKNLVGCCPIHQGSNPNQFSVSLDRNLFNCFGDCRAGGNVLDFVGRMEKVEIHEAAVLLAKWFPGADWGTTGTKPQKNSKLVREKENEAKIEGPVNPPLSFKLKGLDYGHSFFADQGLNQETAAHFGAGYCKKGMMAGRIAIPIENEKGELVAYCGRAISEDQAKEEGKYKMPPGFQKQRIVYNLNRQEAKPSVLILVESFLSVFKLYQYGYQNVVALMGSVLSPDQEELILARVGPGGRILLLFDADEDGQGCAKDCLERLSQHAFVKAVDVSPFARKPHQLSAEQLTALLAE